MHASWFPVVLLDRLIMHEMTFSSHPAKEGHYEKAFAFRFASKVS